MNFPFAQQTKTSTWLKQAAVVISDAPNLLMIMKELIKAYGWTVAEATPSVEKAIESVTNGEATLIIIDDSLAKPSSRALRQLTANPITLCTPTLTFLLESHSADHKLMQTLGNPHIVEKPLTPSKFFPGFTGLLKTWEKEPFLQIRRATYQLIQGHIAEALGTLGKLKEHPHAYRYATNVLSHHLVKAGKVKEAETLLLKAFKKSPRDLLNILSLVDFYLQASMPQFALKLLTNASTLQPLSNMLGPDFMMTHILLGNLQNAIKAISYNNKAGNPDEKSLNFLCRLLLAEGMNAEAERILSQNRTLFKKIETAWLAVDFNNQAAAS